MALKIIEMGWGAFPGGEDTFEVYEEHQDDVMEDPIYKSPSLNEAVQYCYSLGQNFTVYTLAEYDRVWNNSSKQLSLEF